MRTNRISRGIRAAALAALCLSWAAPTAAEAPDGQRLGRARDYIADEQWSRAIDELRGAIADPRETNKDEALFWLAHSQYQSGDAGSAVESIGRLEREYPSSRWVKPARSLRIEIAHRLHRDDVLWFTALPPTPPVQPTPPAHRAEPAVAPAAVSAPGVAAPPAPLPPPSPSARPPRVRVRPALPPPSPAPAAEPSMPVPPTPPSIWVPKAYVPDIDLRIQALSSLIKTDAQKVIPILQEIALDSRNAAEARSAVFVLAQSGLPEAQRTIVQVAKAGPEGVRLAAVRELGRFGGSDASKALLQIYDSSNLAVKRQVVRSLGDRADVIALQRIALSEVNAHLRDVAIVTLGTAGGRDQLRTLYSKVPVTAKRPIIVGLFNARGEDELIRIAEQERDSLLRQEVLMRLRLLGTPKARAYLEKEGER